MSSSNKQFKLLVDVLPLPSIVLTYVLFIALFVVLGVIMGLFGPETYVPKQEDVRFTTGREAAEFLESVSGRDPLEVLLKHVDRFNAEVIFSMMLYPNATLNQELGFSQKISYDIGIWGSYNYDADDPNPTDDYVDTAMFDLLAKTNHTRTIFCPQGRGVCTGIPLFYESFVRYRVYLIRVNIFNQEQQALNHFYEPKITFGFTHVNSKFSVFELVYRYVCLATTFAVFVLFIFVTRLRQPFAYWHTEQKWMVLLLIALFLFNNPLYIFRFLTSNWLFTFANIVFRISFIALFLFSLLVFTHAMMTKQSERSAMFYVPKIVLLGAMWTLFLVTFTFSTLTALEDPSFSIVNDLPFYRYIQGTMMTLLVIYVLWILYYIIRGLSILPELNKYSNKFKVVWGMTLGIIIAAALTFVALNAFGKYNSAIAFVAFQILFNFYTYLLAFLFLPSNKPATVSKSDFEQEERLVAT